MYTLPGAPIDFLFNGVIETLYLSVGLNNMFSVEEFLVDNCLIKLRFSRIQNDLPLVETINSLGNYSTVLFYDNKIIGSGTFLQCGLCAGILTAHHVIGEAIGINLLGNGSDKKLGLAITGYLHRFEVELQYIRGMYTLYLCGKFVNLRTDKPRQMRPIQQPCIFSI